jgi:nucleosome binding factor SPN SPT16 subunit
MSEGKPSVKLDAEKFWKRLKKVHGQWQTNKAVGAWNNSDALCIVSGKTSEDIGGYAKVSSMHLYLLNFEFPEANIIMCEKEVGM